jgi:hypothetical protein
LANTVFKLRRSSVAGKQPNTSTLSIGELGINLTDRKLYSSDGTNIFETGSNLTSLSVFSDITVGNSSVNTVVNSSSITVKSIVANGGTGTANQVLASNGSAIYWTNSQGAGASRTYSITTVSGTQNTFTTPGSFVSGTTDVYLNGVHLSNAEYSEISSNTIQLTENVPNGAVVEVSGWVTINTLVAGSNTTIQFNDSGYINSSANFTWNKNSNTLSVGNSSVNTTISNGNISINGNNISPVQSFRNKIINGNFDIWQRGTSTTTAGYLADRWTTNNTGSSFTSSRQSFTLGQTSVPYEPTYWHRTVVTSSAGASNGVVVRECIESVRTLAGQTATLSFWAKADASKNIAVEFSQIFGTGGSPSSTVTTIGVTTCALTTSFQKFTITVNIPSISGKTLGSNNDDCLELRFWLDAGSSFNSRTNSLGQQSGTFDIAQVQLEAGSVATPFEIRPMGAELSLCQRYYEKSYSQETVPGTATQVGRLCLFMGTVTGTVMFVSTTFSTKKRSTPTITIYSSTNGTTGSVSQDALPDVSATVNQNNNNGFDVSWTNGAGRGGGFYHYTASAEY